MTAADEPQKIVDALVAAGWQVEGRSGGAVRLSHADDTVQMMVPTDPTAPEYGQMVDAVASNLVSAVRLGDAARMALNTMRREGVAP